MSSADVRLAREPRNRRRAFRVPARLPVRHRRLSADERDARERELRVAEPAPRPADPALAAWLQRVESKLDRLAARLGLGEEAPPGPDDLCDVDLSSVGVGLETSQSVAAGDDVLFECMVPGHAPRHVRALARVARVDETVGRSAPRRRVALEFSRISDCDRDALVRFTQDVQRCASL